HHFAQAGRMPFQSDDYVGFVYHHLLGIITQIRDNDSNRQLLSGHKPELPLSVGLGTVRNARQLERRPNKRLLRNRISYNTLKSCIDEWLGFLSMQQRKHCYSEAR